MNVAYFPIDYTYHVLFLLVWGQHAHCKLINGRGCNEAYIGGPQKPDRYAHQQMASML